MSGRDPVIAMLESAIATRRAHLDVLQRQRFLQAAQARLEEAHDALAVAQAETEQLIRTVRNQGDRQPVAGYALAAIDLCMTQPIE